MTCGSWNSFIDRVRPRDGASCERPDRTVITAGPGKISAVILILALGAIAQTQEPCKRFVEPGVGVSYCQPEGWNAVTGADGVTVVTGPATDGFPPNLQGRAFSLPQSLDDLASLMIRQLPEMVRRSGGTNFSLLGKSDLMTAASQRVIKVAFQSRVGGYSLRTTQYFVALEGDRKYILTLTALETQMKNLDLIVDESLKTLQVEKKPNP